MDNLRLGKLVRTVTVLERGPAGELTPIVIFKGKRKKKKGTRGLGNFDRTLRRFADAQAAFSGAYARAHRKSNSKSKDGWLRDVNLNLARAARKGNNKVRWNTWAMP